MRRITRASMRNTHLPYVSSAPPPPSQPPTSFLTRYYSTRRHDLENTYTPSRTTTKRTSSIIINNNTNHVPLKTTLTTSRRTIHCTSSTRKDDLKNNSPITQQSSPEKHNSSSVLVPAQISIEEYHRLANDFLERLLTKLEDLQEEREDVDADYSAGVLTLIYPSTGTYVLNKQPPNKQIWLSSPISGPKRYDWVLDDENVAESVGVGEDESSHGLGIGGAGGDVNGIQGKSGKSGKSGSGHWVYLRDGSTLVELLREEVGVEMDASE